MLGHHEITELLLNNDAQIKVKNNQGWTPLSEAVSYGSRSIIAMILKALKRQSRDSIETRRPELIRALELMGNFTMEVKWDFQSWIPLVSRSVFLRSVAMTNFYCIKIGFFRQIYVRYTRKEAAYGVIRRWLIFPT